MKAILMIDGECKHIDTDRRTTMPTVEQLTEVDKLSESISRPYKYPRVLPSQWRIENYHENGGACYRNREGLVVIMSYAEELDGKVWLHVSMSRKDRMPSYRDMCEVKDLFIGADKMAYQLFVPTEQHVNIHPNALHLWSCSGVTVTPDFTHGLGTV